MSRVAINHRYKCRFQLALDVYQHIEAFSRASQVSANECARMFIVMASNKTVLYFRWAERFNSETSKYRELMNEALLQTQITAKYHQMDHAQKLPKDARMRRAYLRAACEDGNADIRNVIAKNYLYSAMISDNIGISSRQAWAKAFELFTAPGMKFTIEMMNFTNCYTDQLLKLNRVDHATAAKIAWRTIGFSAQEFGKLSFEAIDIYRRAAIYCIYAGRFVKGIKLMQQCVDICKQCLVGEAVHSTRLEEFNRSNFEARVHEMMSQSLNDLGEFHLLNLDLDAALQAHRESVIVAEIVLRMQPAGAPNLCWWTASSIKAVSKIVQNPGVVRADKAKERKQNKRNAKIKRVIIWLQAKEYSQQVVVLLNMAAMRQCAHCKGRANKLQMCSRCKNAFYCNKRHQKMHWEQHRLKCTVD